MFKGIMIRIGRIVFNMSDDFMDGWNKQKLINEQAKEEAHRENYPPKVSPAPATEY